MQDHKFLAKVRQRGNYGDHAEAENVTRAVLGVLAGRLAGGEAGHLASQLPERLRDAVYGVDEAGAGYGIEEFLSRVASTLRTSPEVAKWDTSADHGRRGGHRRTTEPGAEPAPVVLRRAVRQVGPGVAAHARQPAGRP